MTLRRPTAPGRLSAGAWPGPCRTTDSRRPVRRLPGLMSAVIALLPKTERGRRILDDLEVQFELSPLQIVGDDPRRYENDHGGADVDGFEPWLDQVDRGWRD